MNAAERHRYSRAVVDIYRVIDGSQRGPAEACGKIKSDSKVCADLGVMAPQYRVMFARLSMLVHLVVKKQTDLLANEVQSLRMKSRGPD